MTHKSGGPGWVADTLHRPLEVDIFDDSKNTTIRSIRATVMSSHKPWRDTFAVHPAANLFPMLGADELRNLVDDIKKNGLQSKVVLHDEPQRDGSRSYVVIDGRNRLDALERCGWLGASPTSKRFHEIKKGMTDAEITAFVISANIHRRHLTAEQKRELIAKLLKADPTKSNNSIAKAVEADDHTVKAVREKLESRSEIPNVSTVKDTKGRSQPAKKAKPKAPPNPAATVSISTSITRPAGYVEKPWTVPPEESPNAEHAAYSAKRAALVDAILKAVDEFPDTHGYIAIEALILAQGVVKTRLNGRAQ